MHTLDTRQLDFDTRFESFLSSRNDPEPNSSVETRVREIISAVRHDGDNALIRLTQELDHWTPKHPDELRVSEAEIANACDMVGAVVLDDLRLAADSSFLIN